LYAGLPRRPPVVANLTQSGFGVDHVRRHLVAKERLNQAHSGSDLRLKRRTLQTIGSRPIPQGRRRSTFTKDDRIGLTSTMAQINQVWTSRTDPSKPLASDPRAISKDTPLAEPLPSFTFATTSPTRSSRRSTTGCSAAVSYRSATSSGTTRMSSQPRFIEGAPAFLWFARIAPPSLSQNPPPGSLPNSGALAGYPRV
jgi:hypothetical protein